MSMHNKSNTKLLYLWDAWSSVIGCSRPGGSLVDVAVSAGLSALTVPILGPFNGFWPFEVFSWSFLFIFFIFFFQEWSSSFVWYCWLEAHFWQGVVIHFPVILTLHRRWGLPQERSLRRPWSVKITLTTTPTMHVRDGTSWQRRIRYI